MNGRPIAVGGGVAADDSLWVSVAALLASALDQTRPFISAPANVGS